MTREEVIIELNTFKIDAKSELGENALDIAIQALEQQPRWIPVIEDTPPKRTICLWCNKQGSVFTSEITYRSECNSYVGKHGYFSNGLENHGDIIAWMSLPQPYKANNKNKQGLAYVDQDTLMAAT